MTAADLAFARVEELVARFKNIPGAQRKAMNEMQIRLGYIRNHRSLP